MGKKINAGAQFKGSFRKIFQGVTEPFAQIIGKLAEVVQGQVKGKGIQEHPIMQLAFENANENCQSVDQREGRCDRLHEDLPECRFYLPPPDTCECS